ncbi:MAG: T9SS type A sorting domain-containing protein, partial [bacterium]|nr:T9SS type A sorting domain-containing protein [bacterium]
AAVQCAGERGLLFGFGIEAISGMGAGSTSLGGLLDRLFAWGADVLPAETPRDRPAALPTSCRVSPAYPNPFNGQTRIAYEIPSAQGGEFFVYDLMGRAVESRRLRESTGIVEWSPRVASGIYFAVVRWEGGVSSPVKLLFVR